MEERREKIAGYPIVTEYKYLGITINKTLSPEPHLIQLTKKINNFCRLIKNPIIKK